MKNLLLLIVVFAIGIGSYAQKRVQIPKSLRDISVQREYTQPLDGSEITEGTQVVPYKSASVFDEEIIGDNFADQQTNRALMNRTYLYNDGTMGVTWTRGMDAPAFPNRGTGYNYYDGNAWGPWPSVRIETQRCGWPSLAPLGENGEIVVAHNAIDALVINRRDEKGTGTWVETILQGPPGYEKVTWPRIVTSGQDHNIVHVLGQIRNGYNGQEIAQAYYRSQDGGETWDIMNQIIEGVGPDYYTQIDADAEVFAEPRAGVIAFICVSHWHDLFMMKSYDEGDTWEKTVIWEHPYPFWDWDNSITTDTLWVPDNSVSIALDSDGMAHVVLGLSRIAHWEAGASYSYWPYSDGIAYWNETMPPFEDENPHDALDPIDVLIEDYNLIGWTQDVNNNGSIDFLDDLMAYPEKGISTMTNIVVDELNQIFLTFASTTEGYDNTVYNYKHIWVRTSPDNGNTWGDFYDMTSAMIHIYDECIYPLLTAGSDDNIYLMYNVDADPGLASREDHAWQQNKLYFLTILKDDILSINNPVEFTENDVSQNYPNPFNATSVVNVNIRKTCELSLDVINITGQKVFEINPIKAKPGKNTISIDAGKLSPGIYFYTVRAGETAITKKMVVE